MKTNNPALDRAVILLGAALCALEDLAAIHDDPACDCDLCEDARGGRYMLEMLFSSLDGRLVRRLSPEAEHLLAACQELGLRLPHGTRQDWHQLAIWR